MTGAFARILEEAGRLSKQERAELADRLVESLAPEIPSNVAETHIAEVRRRIAGVESGEVSLIPGDEGLVHVRRLIAAPRPAA